MTADQARPDPEPRAFCGGCGERLVGRYCHACGDDSAPPARRLRDLAEDFLDNVLDFTSSVPRTLYALFARPSLVPRAQRSGDRRAFLSPVKLYVSASLVFFLFLGVAGVTFLQVDVVRRGPGPVDVVPDGDTLKPVNWRIEEKWLHRTGVVTRDEELIAAFDRVIPALAEDDANRAYALFARGVIDDPSAINSEIETWAPRALWLLMPVHALLFLPFFRRRLLSEHLIFALWAHAMLFLLLIGGAIWNLTGLGYGLAVTLAAYQAYLTAAIRGYYETGWIPAAARGLAHSAIYFGLVWLPLTAGFFLVQAMRHMPSQYWES